MARALFSRLTILGIFLAMNTVAHGAELMSLDTALQTSYRACMGIDDELSELKKLAGINTAVTAVGTAAGASATIVGLVKAKTDADIRNLRLQVIEAQADNPVWNNDKKAGVAFIKANFDANATTDQKTKEQQLTEKSKKLGDWRTGLMAGATATNIAGAVIAGVSVKKGDIQSHIDACTASMNDLRNAISQAKVKGEDVSEAQRIATACSGYKGQDVSKIQKRAKGALVASVVGSATGVIGTATSAAANSDSVRKAGLETDAGAQKEKNLNTASNVLAGATTAASATATVFNALEISAIKRIAQTAAECEGALR